MPWATEPVFPPPPHYLHAIANKTRKIKVHQINKTVKIAPINKTVKITPIKKTVKIAPITVLAAGLSLEKSDNVDITFTKCCFQNELTQCLKMDDCAGCVVVMNYKANGHSCLVLFYSEKCNIIMQQQ